MPADDSALVVFGAEGQLGRALAEVPLPPGWHLVPVGRSAADVTSHAAVERALSSIPAGVVVNAAAYTAVDRAESEPDAAFAVNRDGAAHVALAAAAQGLPVIHLSTDYVFDGARRRAYAEDDPPAPLSVYGASKYAGERAVAAAAPRHVILRTAWLFGRHGGNFPRTILSLARSRDELRVVADQTGCPTPAEDLARAIAAMAPRLRDAPAGSPLFGLFHCCGGEPASWYDVAVAVLDAAASHGAPVARLRPVPAVDYPLPARRPAWSVLSCDRLRKVHGITLPSWRRAVTAYLPAWLAAP